MNSIVNIRRHLSDMAISPAANDGADISFVFGPEKSFVYSHEYASVFSWRAVVHLPAFIRKSSGWAMAAEMFMNSVGDCRTHEERRRA